MNPRLLHFHEEILYAFPWLSASLGLVNVLSCSLWYYVTDFLITCVKGSLHCSVSSSNSTLVSLFLYVIPYFVMFVPRSISEHYWTPSWFSKYHLFSVVPRVLRFGGWLFESLWIIVPCQLCDSAWVLVAQRPLHSVSLHRALDHVLDFAASCIL